MAFRHFDVNFDGTVDFEEFVNGLEVCGVSMTLKDYKDVFELINFDGIEHIDF